MPCFYIHLHKYVHFAIFAFTILYFPVIFDFVHTIMYTCCCFQVTSYRVYHKCIRVIVLATIIRAEFIIDFLLCPIIYFILPIFIRLLNA